MAVSKFGIFIFCHIHILSLTTANSKDGYDRYKALLPKTQGMPWPLPFQMTSSEDQLFIDKDRFVFNLDQRCDILSYAFKRYTDIIFGADDSTVSQTKRFSNRNAHQKTVFEFAIPRPLRDDDVVTALHVDVQGQCMDDEYPSLQSDESYNLQINPNGFATLDAKQVWGALRGLETFSQLIYNNDDGAFVINVTSITDKPRFQHRGILLDSSRHFLSVNVLKKNLDVMAMNKINVFHWHIVDGTSFPYESYTFPDMSAMSAYTRKEVYSQEDIKDLIEYARLRGIRIIPEFDSPGHSESWGPANPGLLTKCFTAGKWDGSFGPIDPSSNITYPFLTQFFTEISQVFKDQYIHLGGDEVSFDCWKSNPDVNAFMTRMGFPNDYSKLEEYYMTKLLQIVDSAKRNYIIWQEVVDNNVTVAANTVVEVWKGEYQKEMAAVTAKGYKVLLSSPWYLDYISYGKDWYKYYLADPQDFNGTQEQYDLVMGGEACLWGEFVDDTNVLSRLWPRASPIAERLWSPIGTFDVKSAEMRLDEHRCRMVKRGYPAQPIDGPGFCPHEFVQK
ncbi:beta-hexosaminidase subunit beta-like [Dreissena polymorpha]|uniref:Beta-hexosaminidase n=1 Tax=Dreissena polymorpha TaxID=45954 RepID=A0A9D4MGN2_DREPO|nr:beta-hexosaminidase subunit beta-like [Dreissena polymorpha]KAH3874961.1 hypothetical protein DPMN_038219 [Dreissena polymorpha]